MKDHTSLPKVGDHVQISGRPEIYVVAAINEENHSVSLIPATSTEQASATKVISIDPSQSSSEPIQSHFRPIYRKP
ncbi:hypothetical protein [Occallatibacter riparius]|uniref:Uncharacterized protein n=1 Tax=Occallatibacter riparius TaxID=1002689 RepID=A0A9J7BP50_9BACT|nr:hypothetical protein [Occallatibacter riparius]UWZ83530.1 hypothetical protein MOP44_23555 [Occallatibacter riparius]